jgi:hypothetical protein
MRAAPLWSLKLGAGLVTMFAVVASANYVGSHVKNPRAPLHPSVVRAEPAGPSTQLSPGVPETSASPITSTYAS